MLHDPLAAAMTKILNAERVGKREVVIHPMSKFIGRVLEIMNEHQYLGSCEKAPEEKSAKVCLLGNINKCGVITPRFATGYTTFEKWEKRYLPAKDFGILLISTPQGLMTHLQAREKKIGGRLVAYCY